MEREPNTETQSTNCGEQINEPEKVVKNEPDPEEETDFLDDILRNADSIAAAVAGTSLNSVKSEPNANETVEDIDPSFFDEILVRPENERKQSSEIRNQVRLKRERQYIEDGEVHDDNDKNEKNKESGKSKKSKKAKRKKSRESPKKSKNDHAESPATSLTVTESNRPRLQVRADLRSFRVATPPSPPSNEQAASPEHPQTEIETHIGSSACYQPIQFQLSIQEEDVIEQKPEKELTSEEKLSRALEHIKYAKKAFQKAKLQKEKKFYPDDPVFVYIPTVRKLPTSSSYFTQQIYDNRSPLHTVNNVTFQFNSMATRLNLQEWGLESLPPKSRLIARTLAYDVDTLFAKKQSIKIPDKIQKSNQSINRAEEKELCEPSNSTLFMNVMVQTDEVKVIPNRRRDFYYDVGLQFTPPTNVIGTQTNPLYTGEGAELPLFKIIRELNENQLEALDDFVQLILEPAGQSGLDVYQQRKRLADIYKIAQAPAQTSTSLKRSATHAGLSERMPSPPPPPLMNMHLDFIKQEQKTYNHSSERRRPQPPFRRGVHSTPIYSYEEESDNEPPTPSVKYYGRGGMRR